MKAAILMSPAVRNFVARGSHFAHDRDRHLAVLPRLGLTIACLFARRTILWALRQLSGLEEDLNQERDCLTRAKKERDGLRREVASLRQSQGFANRCVRELRKDQVDNVCGRCAP